MPSPSPSPTTPNLSSLVYSDLISQSPWKWLIAVSISLFLITICVFAFRMLRDQLVKFAENTPMESIKLGSFSLSDKIELDKLEEEQSALIETLNNRIELLEADLNAFKQGTDKQIDDVKTRTAAALIATLVTSLNPQSKSELDAILQKFSVIVENAMEVQEAGEEQDD